TERLYHTPELLPVLKKAGVVDAGGKGLVVIFEGMYRVFKENIIIQTKEGDSNSRHAIDQPIALDNYDQEITFTYCTEFIIDKNDKNTDDLKLRAYLESIGDSVVVVDDDDIIKCHLHTDDPGNAMQEALKLGMLSRIKIDNMREQSQNNKAIVNASKQSYEYQAVDRNIEYGFVAVSAGEGNKQLFSDLGADNIVTGGQTMNPSTDDILRAIHATPAKNIFVLPNNKNIIMAAEQAVKLADRNVFVLPTRTIPQGFSAMLAFDPQEDIDSNVINMSKAYEKVVTGQITFAARDSEFDGHNIKKGEVLALENSKLAFTEKELSKAVVRLLKHLIKKELHKDTIFVTIIFGQDVTEKEVENILQTMDYKLPENVEVSVINGGQPIYYYFIAVE
ncbi:MAG: DAK2 domain-containing protein, partial [Oscillospiraceae bacterium]